MALSCHGPVRVLQLCAVFTLRGQKHHMRPHYVSAKLYSGKTAMSTSLSRRDVYRGALVAAGSIPLLAACDHRDPGWALR